MDISFWMGFAAFAVFVVAILKCIISSSRNDNRSQDRLGKRTNHLIKNINYILSDLKIFK